MYTYTNVLLNHTNAQLEEIKQRYSSEKTQIDLSIALLENTIWDFNQWLRSYEFKSTEEEIDLFKNIKPTLVSQLLFYTTLSNWRLEQLTYTEDLSLFYNIQTKEILQKIKTSEDFKSIVTANCTKTDQIYFMRNLDDQIPYLKKMKYLNYDTRLYTPKDFLWSKLICYDLLLEYLEKIQYKQKNTLHDNFEKLSWNAENLNFVELFYSLHYGKIIGNGTLSFECFIQKLEVVFDIKISKNIYKKVNYLKNKIDNSPKIFDQLRDIYSKKINEK